MGLFSWIPGVGDLIDTLTGEKANQYNDKALGLEEQKLKYQQEGADRLRQIFETLWGKVKSFDQSGGFDPNARVERATERFNKNAEHQQRTLGAGLTAAGYKPTDSEVKYNTNRLGRAQAHDLAVTQDQAAQGALSDQLNAYRATDPSLIGQSSAMVGNGTDTLAGAYSNMAANNQGPGLAGLFSTILPFLKPGSKMRTGWGSTALGLPGDRMNSDGSYGGM